jgi:transposase
MTNRHPIIIGIDTHKASHVAVAIDSQGTRLAALSIPANTKGYRKLERWSCPLGEVHAFGIEGTGSYGAELSRSLLSCGYNVVEVTRPNRQLRYTQGKPTALTQKAPLGQFCQDRQLPVPKHKLDHLR